MSNDYQSWNGYNARSLTLEGICDNFIPNDFYRKAAACEHSILIGPRGAGKTTLLKMLQPEAIDMWHRKNKQQLHSKLDFIGVFIATDKMWKTQYDAIKITNNEDAINACHRIFELHIIEKILSTAYYLSRNKESTCKKLSLLEENEIELVDYLSEQIGVQPKIRSIRSLTLAIAVEKNRISLNIKNNEISETDSVEISISNSVDILIKAINLYSEKQQIWCLLFDELELAPDEFVQPLIDAMRGGPENVLFKLAMSPYHKDIFTTKTTVSSMRNEDFTLINLSIANESSLEFSKKLMSKAMGVSNPVGLDDLFEQPKDECTFTLFNRLAKKDRSFYNYLKDRDISLDFDIFESYTENDKLPLIRKIKPIVKIRDACLKENGARRSNRRVLDFYAGLNNILRCVENNPRMIIGMANHFRLILEKRDSVAIHFQLRILRDFHESFSALLSTIKFTSNNKNIVTARDFIQIIADNFKNEVIGENFIGEPKGSIVFNKSSYSDFSEAIGCCLNSGALIAEEPIDDLIDINKARCRLSYIFSPNNMLLLTLQRATEFENIVHGIRKINIYHAYKNIDQLSWI